MRYKPEQHISEHAGFGCIDVAGRRFRIGIQLWTADNKLGRYVRVTASNLRIANKKVKQILAGAP